VIELTKKQHMQFKTLKTKMMLWQRKKRRMELDEHSITVDGQRFTTQQDIRWVGYWL
jgi:hypothetical protein